VKSKSIVGSEHWRKAAKANSASTSSDGKSRSRSVSFHGKDEHMATMAVAVVNSHMKKSPGKAEAKVKPRQ